MFCPKCGEELPDIAKFCGYCGHKLEKKENRKQNSAKAKELEKKKFVKKFAIAVLGCCVCLPILVYFSLFHNSIPDLRCGIDDGEASIEEYNETESEIVLPETDSSLTGTELEKGVTKIDEGAFEGDSSLTSIELPEGVTEIEKEAFKNSSLTSIVLPDGVTKIGDSAFLGCVNRKRWIVRTYTKLERTCMIETDLLRSYYFTSSLPSLRQFAGRFGDQGSRSSRKARSVSSRCLGISVSRYSK